ncbi:MAG: heavy-metal-associated domain-containing protein [Alistipes sp.]|nr:heavy-metal-associated domain-containing protein [Alistipes sp.]
MKKIVLFCLLAVLGFGINEASAQKQAAAVKTTVFLTDIDCEGCAKKITNSIPFQKGVKDVKVDVPTKLVTVTYDSSKTNDAALLKAFQKVKVKAEVAPKKK